MLTFAKQKYSDCADELDALLPTHSAEVETNLDDVPWELDREALLLSEKMGYFHVFTVREEPIQNEECAKGELVGYLYCSIGASPHHKTTPHGWVNGAYLLPEYRGNGNGARLYRMAEDFMREHGVVTMVVACTSRYDLTPLFSKLGFAPCEVHFSKIIKDNA